MLGSKYIYGPGVDQPVCMIEVADSNATYYYHFDALGSVVALSDAAGDTVQTYEYSVYGEVAVEDANHTNPYMFAGRRFDIEIGLYYNRARYYHPFTGRFLQTDPIGYGDGMNWYAYCGNNPVRYLDPLGLTFWDLKVKYDPGGDYDKIVFEWTNLGDTAPTLVNPWDYGYIIDCNSADQADVEAGFRSLWALPTGRELVEETAQRGITIKIDRTLDQGYFYKKGKDDKGGPLVMWNPQYKGEWDAGSEFVLGHELIHANHYLCGAYMPRERDDKVGYWKEEARTRGVILHVRYVQVRPGGKRWIEVFDFSDSWLNENKLRGEGGKTPRGDIYITIYVR
ncbi:MAG: RHS repeat-associated core domain-containing protein [Planctomycetota bacterium]